MIKQEPLTIDADFNNRQSYSSQNIIFWNLKTLANTENTILSTFEAHM